MGWSTIAGLILNYGIPFAEKLWQKVSSGTLPTQADWDELKALQQNTPKSQLLAALARANVDPNSPAAQALIALLPQS